MRDIRLLTLGTLSIDARDIFAVWKFRDERGEASRADSMFDESIVKPAVKVFTRLRESGSRDALLTFEFSGAQAREVWESMERLARPDATNHADWVRCGVWHLRPDRVRIVRRTSERDRRGEREKYAVFVTLSDGEHDGGWVARLDLDQEAGQALDTWRRQQDT